MNPSKLEREVRLLKACALVSSLALAVLLAGAFQPQRGQRTAVLEVERINVVEPDGRLALVTANADSANVARLEFLDESGRVIQTLPERS